MRCVLRRATVSCFLMSADAMGAMFDPGPTVLGCDGQVDLAARGKASIQWQSEVASSKYVGQTTRGCRQELGWVNKSQEGGTEMWCATRGAVSTRWISKHTDGVMWMGQYTQGEERTQTESGFMLSNGRFGVAEPVFELSTYAISIVPPALTCRDTSCEWRESRHLVSKEVFTAEVFPRVHWEVCLFVDVGL